MLVGLDLLIAADIIKTVTVDPTLENVATLGLLVLIRTFLSWSIVVESPAGGRGRNGLETRPSNTGGAGVHGSAQSVVAAAPRRHGGYPAYTGL